MIALISTNRYIPGFPPDEPGFGYTVIGALEPICEPNCLDPNPAASHLPRPPKTLNLEALLVLCSLQEVLR